MWLVILIGPIIELLFCSNSILMSKYIRLLNYSSQLIKAYCSYQYSLPLHVLFYTFSLVFDADHYF
jgi:hypothetical protein